MRVHGANVHVPVRGFQSGNWIPHGLPRGLVFLFELGWMDVVGFLMVLALAFGAADPLHVDIFVWATTGGVAPPAAPVALSLERALRALAFALILAATLLVPSAFATAFVWAFPFSFWRPTLPFSLATITIVVQLVVVLIGVLVLVVDLCIFPSFILALIVTHFHRCQWVFPLAFNISHNSLPRLLVVKVLIVELQVLFQLRGT